MFVDHIPDNVLARYTLHNFGCSDAAEIFVLLEGCSSMIAYGRSFERGDVSGTLRRIGVRCLRIYLFQAGLLLGSLVIVREWSALTGLVPRFGVAPLLSGGVLRGMGQGLLLYALPNYIDILPLYVVLLALFPVFYAGLRRAPVLTVGVSGMVWLAANLDHRLNLPNVAVIDGSGWYFDPFAWQFLFLVGALLARATATRSRLLDRHRWLVLLAWTYLVFAMAQAAPWAAWGLPNLSLFPMAPPDKSHLSLVQLIDSGALIYLLFSSPRILRLSEYRALRPLAACGRHSLEVFTAGCLAALAGRIVFRTYGTTWPIQAGINLFGIVVMIAVAHGLDAFARPTGRQSGPISPHATAMP